MKISPGVQGYEKYSKFFACALHKNLEKDKKKLKNSTSFLENCKKELNEFLTKFQYCDAELENQFNL